MHTTRRVFFLSAAAPALYLAASEKNPVRVVAVPESGIQPQIAVDESGLHLIYFTGDAKHGDVFYTRSRDFGATWTGPLRVNSQPNSAVAVGAIRGAQLSIGKSGRVHVAWNGSDLAQPRVTLNPKAGTFPMLYSRLNASGAAFEPQRNLMRETFGLDGGGSVTADREGNVYVAWHGGHPGAPEGEAGRRVWVAKSKDDGSTFAMERPASPDSIGACGCCGMRIFADSKGAVYALFRSATNNVHRDIYLLRSTDRAETFSCARLHKWDINACPMSSMAFLESGNEVIGAWETQTQIYFSAVSPGVDAQVLTPGGDNPKRKYPSLARNHRGETLVAWIEGSGWGKGGVLGWQIFDRAGRPLVSSTDRLATPTWSFPAAFTHPDGRFGILV